MSGVTSNSLSLRTRYSETKQHGLPKSVSQLYHFPWIKLIFGFRKEVREMGCIWTRHTDSLGHRSSIPYGSEICEELCHGRCQLLSVSWQNASSLLKFWRRRTVNTKQRHRFIQVSTLFVSNKYFIQFRFENLVRLVWTNISNTLIDDSISLPIGLNFQKNRNLDQVCARGNIIYRCT